MNDTVIRDISSAEAELLRARGLPDGVRIYEREEVDYWGNVYARPEGSCLYVPDQLDPIERYIPTVEQKVLLGCDLFAGAGGFSCGMQRGGIDVVCAVEYSPEAAATYTYNLGTPDMVVHFDTPDRERRWRKALTMNPMKTEADESGHTLNPFRPGEWGASPKGGGCRGFYCGDITKVDGAFLLELSGVDHFDVIFGGPPCQGMSTANANRAVDDPRNAMLFEFMRIVCELRPKVFLIENVPPLLTFGDGVLFKRVCDIANDAGYNVTGNIIDAANYGVPQTRRRALVAGTLGKCVVPFPMPQTWSIGSMADGKSWDMLSNSTDASGSEQEQRGSRAEPLTLFENVED